MSEFLDVFLNHEETHNNGQHINESCSPTDVINKDDVIVKIRDQELVNNEYIRYFIEVNVKSDNHFWLERAPERSWSVYRRYREFEELQKLMIKSYPASLVPPLPTKMNSINPLKMANQVNDSDFIDCRRQRLEWFLKRLLDHPKLKNELFLYNFLRENSDWKWSDNIGQSVSEKVGNVINWRWLNIQSHLINLFDESSQMNEIIKSNTLTDEAKTIVDRGTELQRTTKILIEGLSKMEAETKMLHMVYKNFGEAFYDWCGYVDKLGNGLQTFGHLCDTFATIIDNQGLINKPIIIPSSGSNVEASSAPAKLRKQQLLSEPLSWTEMSLLLQEYYEYGESWINLGGRLSDIQRRIIRLKEHIISLTDQIDKLQNGQPQKVGMLNNIRSKFQKQLTAQEIEESKNMLNKNLTETKQKLEALKSSQDLFVKCLDDEVDYFERVYARGMQHIIYSYSYNQLVHNERCHRLWVRARQSLDQMQ